MQRAPPVSDPHRPRNPMRQSDFLVRCLNSTESVHGSSDKIFLKVCPGKRGLSMIHPPKCSLPAVVCVAPQSAFFVSKRQQARGETGRD